MGAYDALMAAPEPTQAQAAPAPTETPAASDPYAALMAAPEPAAPPAPKKPKDEDRGFLDALGRSAANGANVGFGPTVDAGITTALSKIPWLRDLAAKVPGIDPSVANPDITYDQRRAAAAGALDSARKYHPIASTFGEMAGNTLATMALPESEALAAASPVVRGAVVGGGLGYTQGVGESVSHGQDLDTALKNGGKEAIVGGLTGGALEGTTGHLLDKATQNADGWIVKELAGTDAATRTTNTAGKHLSKDAEDIKRLIKSDPELRAASEAAASGDLEKLKTLDQTLDQRLEAHKQPRLNNYDVVRDAKPIRFGDLDAHLEDEIKSLPASDVNVKRALQGQRDLLKKEWATKEIPESTSYTLDPNKEVLPGFTAGQALKNYQDVMAKAKTPESAAQAQAAIDSLHKEWGDAKVAPAATKYDPETVIDPLILRQHTTALQSATADTMGSLNEHERYKTVQKVERPFTRFLDEHLEQAAKTSPEAAKAVDSIRANNDEISAALNIKKAVAQRIDKATRKDQAGMKPAFGFRGAIHQVTGGGLPGVGVALALGHPGVAAGLAATTVAPIAKAALDKSLAAIIRAAAAGHVPSQLLEEAVRTGVPRALALRIADSARKGTLNNVIGHLTK